MEATRILSSNDDGMLAAAVASAVPLPEVEDVEIVGGGRGRGGRGGRGKGSGKGGRKQAASEPETYFFVSRTWLNGEIRYPNMPDRIIQVRRNHVVVLWSSPSSKLRLDQAFRRWHLSGLFPDVQHHLPTW